MFRDFGVMDNGDFEVQGVFWVYVGVKMNFSFRIFSERLTIYTFGADREGLEKQVE